MILGSFHFQGSLDVVQTETEILMYKEKQQEINVVVKKLSEFNPTKVAVEVEKQNNRTLTDNYHDYIKNKFDLTVNEIHQLGFKLSKRLNLENIFGIDWMENIGQKSINEVLDWAHQNQPTLYQKIMSEYISKLDVNLSDLSVSDALRKLNNKERIKLDHQMYMQVSKIGNNNEYIGISWVR